MVYRTYHRLWSKFDRLGDEQWRMNWNQRCFGFQGNQDNELIRE